MASIIRRGIAGGVFCDPHPELKARFIPGMVRPVAPHAAGATGRDNGGRLCGSDLPRPGGQHSAGHGIALQPAAAGNSTGNFVKVVQRISVKIVCDRPAELAKYLLVPAMSVVPEVNIKK